MGGVLHSNLEVVEVKCGASETNKSDFETGKAADFTIEVLSDVLTDTANAHKIAEEVQNLLKLEHPITADGRDMRTKVLWCREQARVRLHSFEEALKGAGSMP